MFDQLTEKFQNVFTSLRGKQSITEENIDSAIREVKRALIIYCPIVPMTIRQPN